MQTFWMASTVQYLPMDRHPAVKRTPWRSVYHHSFWSLILSMLDKDWTMMLWSAFWIGPAWLCIDATPPRESVKLQKKNHSLLMLFFKHMLINGRFKIEPWSLYPSVIQCNVFRTEPCTAKPLFCMRTDWNIYCNIGSIDNLQNYCLGSSRGKSRLLRWLSRWLHSHLHGEMTSSCTRAQSFLPKLQLSVWLSLDLSLVPYYDADWRPLVCFGPTNRRSKNIRSFRSAMSKTSEFALAFIIESLAKLATASPFFMFLPTLIFLHIFLFPVTSETASRSLSRGRRCSAVSRATLFCRSSPTETGQSPCPPMSIRLPCCGRQKQVKLAMDVKRPCKRRARMTPGKIKLQREKTWKLEQTIIKEVAALLNIWLAGALEWTSTS